MTLRRFRVGRWVAVGILIAVAATTALAQRGGSQYGRQSYSGNPRYDGKFVFVRMSYPDNMTRQGPYWAHDYPTGEEKFMNILTTISNVRGHVEESSIMDFSDPEIFKNAVIYLCEPGHWSMGDAQVANLRAYLQKGGFMIVDDFRYRDWPNFEYQMSRVFPDLRAIDLTPKHPIFHTFFEIDDFSIVHNYYDPPPPIFRAYFEGNDDRKRMLVMVNYNTDISEYWEWSGQGYRPVEDNNEAFKIGVNEFIYGITH